MQGLPCQPTGTVLALPQQSRATSKAWAASCARLSPASTVGAEPDSSPPQPDCFGSYHCLYFLLTQAEAQGVGAAGLSMASKLNPQD